MKYEALVNVLIGGVSRKAGETFTAEPGLVQAADIRDGLVRELPPAHRPPVSAVKKVFGRKSERKGGKS